MTSDNLDIHIKIADTQDIEMLFPLVTAYHKFEGFKVSESQRYEALKTLLGNNNLGAIWKINAQEKLVGYIAICKGFSIEFGGFDAFVDEFFIEEKVRGLGIGKKVLALLKREIVQLDIKALHLEVAKQNYSAQRLYATAGFEPREKYLIMTLDPI